jgi:hypothetical protein
MGTVEPMTEAEAVDRAESIIRARELSASERAARLTELVERFPNSSRVEVCVASCLEQLAMAHIKRRSSVETRIETAFTLLRADYVSQGSWKYPGQRDADEGWGWIGPYAWSEADYQHRFASLLEEEFPGAVHLEMPINERMRSDLYPLPPGVKRRSPQYIDIVISNLAFLADMEQTAEAAGATFRKHQHEAFIEVKWYWQAAARWTGNDRKRFLADVRSDLNRLHVHLQRGRCCVAAMLVVDDRGTFLPQLPGDAVPAGVMLLPLAPPIADEGEGDI